MNSSFLSFALLGVFAGSGCHQYTSPSYATGHPALDSEFAEAASGSRRASLLAGHFPTCRFKDTMDAGDDPFVAGCHVHYSEDQNCSGTPTFLQGDACIDATHLNEWTDTTCHPASPEDKVTHDCDAECKKKGAQSGICAVALINCLGNQERSAKCECIPFEKPPTL